MGAEVVGEAVVGLDVGDDDDAVGLGVGGRAVGLNVGFKVGDRVKIIDSSVTACSATPSGLA